MNVTLITRPTEVFTSTSALKKGMIILSALSSKLTRAGIPITCPEDGIPLCDILQIKSLFATVALRPNSFGDVENRLRAIHQTLGGMTGAATSLLCATPISKDQNADQCWDRFGFDF